MKTPRRKTASRKKDPSKGGRPTEAEIAARTVRILAVATKLFIENGFAATTIDEIAKSAGVAKKTLYGSYGDKVEIFGAVIKDRISRSGISSFTLTVNKASAEKTLRAAAIRMTDLFFAEGGVDVRRLIIAESRRFPDLMLRFISDSLTHLMDTITALLSDMNEHGMLRITNPRRAAKVFIDLTVGIAYLHVTAGFRATIPSTAEVDEKVAMFVKFYS